jgi:hypothetical protein
MELRSAAGARRAIPRRIHGVCLAITAAARSERRIAVRGPGVGVIWRTAGLAGFDVFARVDTTVRPIYD